MSSTFASPGTMRPPLMPALLTSMSQPSDGLNRGGNRGVIGDVKLHESAADCVGRLLAPGDVARSDPHLVAGDRQLTGCLETEPPACPRDQCRRHCL
jgi:hypothetical protein